MKKILILIVLVIAMNSCEECTTIAINVDSTIDSSYTIVTNLWDLKNSSCLPGDLFIKPQGEYYIETRVLDILGNQVSYGLRKIYHYQYTTVNIKVYLDPGPPEVITID